MAQIISARARRKVSNRGIGLVLAGSFIVHGAAVGGIALYQNMSPGAPSVVIRSMPVELVKLGKRRDPALLPRLSAPPPPPPAEGIALDDGKKTLPTKKKPKDDKRRRDPELSSAAQRLLNAPTPNRLDRAVSNIDEEGDPNGSIYGTTTDPSKGAAGYVALVAARLKERYQLPQTIPSAQRRFLKARVVLFIEINGRISKYDFTEPHPNQAFMSALENLLKSIQLPPPPKGLAKRYRETGLEVVFKPN